MIVKLGVWCDYVTEEEYRAELVETVRAADGATFPIPAKAPFLASSQARVHPRRSRPASTKLSLFWMDEDDGAEDHCEDLSDGLHARGIHITATELRRLPYEVYLSDRLRTRLPR